MFFAYANAENIDKFEPKSHFWLYFVIVFFLLVITFYFYSKTKYIEKNKKNAMYSFILLLSLGSSYFLDLDYKNKQVKNIISEGNKQEISTKAKLKITRIRSENLKEKIRELESENAKLKLLEEKIKNSQVLNKNTILSEKDNLKSQKIKNNIREIEDDLLAIEKNIQKVNTGDYSDSLMEEYTILQKLKNKKKQRELELQAKQRNLRNTNLMENNFSINVNDELENM